ncbi:MAG: hypothetical protein NWS85_10230, partial [Hydrogenophaga sp.]|nr:hypothetical protein [Hydrogenophaga sp.]
TLNASRDVNVNQAINGTGPGTGGSLALNAGRDVKVGAAITLTTRQLEITAAQDVHLSAATTITTGTLQAVAGRNVTVQAAATVTTGSIVLRADNDITVNAAATVTTGNIVLRADNDGTGPGAAAGTVSITCGTSCLTVTTGELNIRFNPVDYAGTGSEITAYAGHLTGGGRLNAKAWVFGQGDNKVYDGDTTASVSGLMPDVTAVLPPVSLGAVSHADFDTPNVGTDKRITYAATFSDGAYELFAAADATAGTYQTRADITPHPLAVYAVTDARAYNGTTSSVGLPTVAGLQTGDTLNGTLSQAFASKNVLGDSASTLVVSGSYSVSDGNGGNNYSVSVFTAPGTITPAPLTVTAQNVSKVYGQIPVLSGYATTALVNGETVGSVMLTSVGQVATAPVVSGPFAIVASSAKGGTFTPSNYNINYVGGLLTVMPAAVVPPIESPNLVDPDVSPQEPPEVVVPEVVVPPEESSLTESEQDPPWATSEEQGLPNLPLRDDRVVLLTVLPFQPLIQGPVKLAVTENIQPAPLQTPIPDMVFPLPSDPQTVQEKVQPRPPMPLPLTLPVPFPPKQDRN